MPASARSVKPAADWLVKTWLRYGLLQVVEELVLICKRVHRAKLRTIPPLPNWVKELTALNEVRGVGADNGSLGSKAEAQLWTHAGLLSLPLAAPAPS